MQVRENYVAIITIGLLIITWRLLWKYTGDKAKEKKCPELF